MGKKYLLLWLEGPLQSWGFDSKFGRRDSLQFPTKSGIYGMLLSALGASGPQKELLEELNSFSQTVLAFSRSKWREGINEKLERHPMLMDFHMVGSGYDSKDPWEKLLIPKTSEGKATVGGGSKMTYRNYLQDTTFAVVQELTEEFAVMVISAIQEPVHELFLGRKSCIPTEWIYQGQYNSVREAKEKADELAIDKNLLLDFSVEEGEQEGEVLTLTDVPIQYGKWKKYSERLVTIVRN